MESSQPTMPKPRLMDQVRTTIRLRGMSYRTEQTYADWIKRFILFHGKRHPREMGAEEIRSIFHIPFMICYLSLQDIFSDSLRQPNHPLKESRNGR